KPRMGAAFVRTKLKNIKNGVVVEKSFRTTEKCEKAHIERNDMQYLYNDGDLFYFVDPETYDQIPISSAAIG
ncbi:elongation factor P, partial [Coprococcus eutactus]|nr:elongation factor P [Coprococcus eutactus]